MTPNFDIFSADQALFATPGESASYLKRARDRFGVLNLSYWFLGASSDQPDRLTWLSTYDQAYTEIYLRDYSPRKDRAFRLCFSRLLPLDWDEARQADETVQTIHEVAERYGVGRHGISIPIRDPGTGDALFSINFDCEDRHWNALRSAMANDVHLFAHYFHQRMRGVIATRPASSAFDLSARERDVLRWAACGKTARETSRLLKVSESAVNLYLRNAMAKLGAVNKPQAVAIAVRSALIN